MGLVLMVLRWVGLVIDMAAKRLGAKPGCQLAHEAQQTAAFRETGIAPVRTDSFPSSHATTAFAGAVVLSFLLPRFWPLFIAAATLVAFSRLYVGVHYPTDVIAGAAIGAGFAAAVITLVTKTRFGRRLSLTKERRLAWL